MSREFFSRTSNPDEHATKKEGGFNSMFRKIASRTATAVGSKWAFMLSILIVVVWAATGPIFHFSDTWQLVINTGTTIVTFLMVFLIQNTQNRDAKAIQLKLDELLRGVKGARTNLVNLEDSSDEELEHLQRQFARLRVKEEARSAKPSERAVARDIHHAAREAETAQNKSEEAELAARRACARDTARQAQQTADQALVEHAHPKSD